MIWTWPQTALSYRELRLKPHPLTQFCFSVFHYLICEGWHVKLCRRRMTFNFPFAALGLTWIKKTCFMLAYMCARVCVCALCECTQHGIPSVKTSAIFEYPEYAKLPQRLRGAGQNVSWWALTCFILEDHTNRLYDVFVFYSSVLFCFVSLLAI